MWRVPMRRFVAGSQCGGLWRVPNAAVCGGFQCGGLWRVPMRRFVAGSNAAVCGGFHPGRRFAANAAGSSTPGSHTDDPSGLRMSC